jgi:hypothetical protein
MCGVVLTVPGLTRLSPRVRRSIVRCVAIVGDSTILAMDVVPLTFGLLTVVRDGALYDAGQEYLRTAFITAIALAALFVLLDWGNTVRLMLSRLCSWCLEPPPLSPPLLPAASGVRHREVNPT